VFGDKSFDEIEARVSLEIRVCSQQIEIASRANPFRSQTDLSWRPPQRQSRAFVLTHLLTLGSRSKSRMQMRSNASARKYLRERIEPLD